VAKLSIDIPLGRLQKLAKAKDRSVNYLAVQAIVEPIVNQSGEGIPQDNSN